MHSTTDRPPIAGFDRTRELGRSIRARDPCLHGWGDAHGGHRRWARFSGFGRDGSTDFPGFWKTLMHQLFWMLVMGFPLVGLVHIAMGSFLSLQAYYGSTFVDGTGAVVGVGLLRNLGGTDDRA